MEIVIFEMFLFNEITGFFSKTGEKKWDLFSKNLYKEHNFGVESGILWKQSGLIFLTISFSLLFLDYSKFHAQIPAKITHRESGRK